jgi:hypothetical protein
MAAAAFPQVNPTGQNFIPTTGASTGAPVMAGTGGPGNFNFGNAMNANPPMTPGTSVGSVPQAGPAPTTGNPPLGPGGAPPGIAGFNTAEQQNLQNTLAGTFHTGYGTYLEQLLNSQGGYNSALTSQNVSDTIAAMQQNINTGYGSLQTQLGEQGISPNSSTAALESSNFMSNAVTQENAIVAQDYYQMWDQSMGREFSLAQSIEGPTAAEKASESTMAKLQGIGQFIGNVFGGNASVSGTTDSGTSWTL